MGKLTLYQKNSSLAILLPFFVVIFLTSVAAASTNSLFLLKEASPATYSTVGQNIEYTYTVINIGPSMISGSINITDDHILNKITITNGAGLTSNATYTTSATYTITQKDLDNGYVTNSAYATNDGINSNTFTQTVTANQNPALTIFKIPSIKTYDCVGQNITYTYIVTNSGNVDLLPGNITVTDNRTGTFNITDSSLNVGQSVVATANYTIIPGDLCACSVTNSANATCNFTNSKGTYQVPSNNITVSVFNGKKKCCETCGGNTCGAKSSDGSDGGKGFCGQETGFKAKFKSTDQINEDENMCHTKNIKEKKECEWQDRGLNENTMIFKPRFSNIQKEEKWGIKH
jgi:uncharacterized repeat protein (TIGR01451 family)